VGGDLQVLVAQPPDDVEGLARLLLARQSQRVGFHVLLDRGPHLRRRPEEPVSRHQPRQPLMRPLEVVVLDEVGQPVVQVLVVGEHRPRQVLVPQRLPEALDLAQCLRVLWPALAVGDPVLAQQLLEGGLPPPGRVLPPLVGQHFPGLTVQRDASLQRLEDQLPTLVVCQRVRHYVP
jgi:hypothetical protein